MKASTRSRTLLLALASVLTFVPLSASFGACVATEIFPKEAKAIVLQTTFPLEAVAEKRKTFVTIKDNERHPRFYFIEVAVESGPGFRVTHIGNGILGRYLVSRATGAVWLDGESDFSPVEGWELAKIQAEVRRAHCIELDFVVKEDGPSVR